MPNIVIATQDEICQSAKNWFVKHQDCINDGSRIDELGDGDFLYIIAHDAEMKDGTEFIEYICKFDSPMSKFTIRMIVCSAASLLFSKGLMTPAERIANHFKRTVWASKTVVTGIWNDDGNANFKGDFIRVDPETDIETLMERLKI